MTVWNAVLADVVGLSDAAASLAAVGLTSLASVAVAVCFAVETGCGAVELVHVAE